MTPKPLSIALLIASVSGCSCTPAATSSTKVESCTLTVNKDERHFRLVMPKSKPTRAAIVVFHGAGDTPESMAKSSRLDDFAKDGYAVVYPEGIGKAWHDVVVSQGKDVRFFEALLDDLAVRGIPVERVHLVGMSQGASMAQIVAAFSQRAASLTVHSGWLPPDLKRANYNYPVLLIHGQQDQQVPAAESELAQAAYQKWGHDVELFIDPDIGHVWSPQANAKITLLLERAATHNRD